MLLLDKLMCILSILNNHSIKSYTQLTFSILIIKNKEGAGLGGQLLFKYEVSEKTPKR